MDEEGDGVKDEGEEAAGSPEDGQAESAEAENVEQPEGEAADAVEETAGDVAEEVQGETAEEAQDETEKTDDAAADAEEPDEAQGENENTEESQGEAGEVEKTKEAEIKKTEVQAVTAEGENSKDVEGETDIAEDGAEALEDEKLSGEATEEKGPEEDKAKEDNLAEGGATEDKPAEGVATGDKPADGGAIEDKPAEEKAKDEKPKEEKPAEEKPKEEKKVPKEGEDEEEEEPTEEPPPEEEGEEALFEIVEEEEEEEFIVYPFAEQSPEGTIPPDIFEFIHSYGFDCQRCFNLCALDEDTVAWASGSYITFYNMQTKEETFRRSSSGGSIGAIAKNPDTELSHVAIAEGGMPWSQPLILIYEWPSMEMLFILRKGTARSYAKLDYSPNGGLLASVGGPPDYNLTVWNWQRHRILLQASAFSFTVDNVLFSPYIPGQLTTSGASHVKFWKMSETFTGLKLKGELGRFGKTEICDILGVYPMPDEKVLTGCTWGNILVWEGGLVKLEVRKKGKFACHDGPISYFLRNDETAEVTTVGMDGYIKSWYWETVDEAVVGAQEGGNFVEMNNVTEFCVPGAQLVNITRKKGSLWFGQDARGSIWTIDLDIDSPDWKEPVRETLWHGNSIVGLEVLRGSREILVSLSSDGTLGLSEIPTGPMRCLTPIGQAKCMLYLPKELNRTGRLLLIGNDDGNIKLIAIIPEHLDGKTEIVTDDSCIKVLQILKPHKDEITTMSLNNDCDILVTASLDCTLFIYKVQPGDIIPQLIPLCYIDTPKVINHINWSLTNKMGMFLCANDGLLMEVVLPAFERPPPTDTITYRGEFVYKHEQYFKEYTLRYTLPDEDDGGFMSLDSESEEEEETKKKEGEGGEEEEEEEKKEEPPEVELVIYRDKSTRPLLFSLWDPWIEGMLWVIPEGLGCIFYYKPRSLIPIHFAPLPEDSWETNICTTKYLKDQDIMMLGKSDGEIFMFRQPTFDEENFQKNFRKREKKAMKDKSKEKPELILRADIVDFLRLGMHDCTSGNVAHMVFNNSEKYFFTGGTDGNIFSYHFSLAPEMKAGLSYDILHEAMLPELHELAEEDAALCHEDLAQEKERQRLLLAATLHKQRVRNQLADLTIEFKQILKRDMALPPKQQIDLNLDDRIMEEEDKILADQMALTRRKLAYPLAVASLRLNKLMSRNVDDLDIFPFQVNSMMTPGFNVKIIRQNKLPPKFFDDMDIVKDKLNEAIRKMEEAMRKDDEGGEDSGRHYDDFPDAPLLYWLPPKPPPTRALVSALRNYLNRITRHFEQEKEWQKHLDKHSFDHIEREGAAALEYEEANIGEYHLKSRPATKLPTSKGAITLHETHLRLFANRQEIYEIQHDFNLFLIQLRKDKTELVKKFAELDQRLKEIWCALPPAMCQLTPFDPLPSVDRKSEYPEENLKLLKPTRVRISKDFGRLRKSIVVTPPSQKSFAGLRIEDPAKEFWKINDASIHKVKGTPLEEDFKKRHIKNLLVEQEEIIKFMNMQMAEWEGKLKKASRERERVLLKTHYLKLSQLQLTQEFIVLDSMQFKEDTLMELVRGHQMDCKLALDQVKELQRQIEDMIKDIAAGNEEIKVLEHQQKRLALEVPKFTKFLKRVFKKKLKPPKNDSDEEESESESETEESDSEESDSEGELDVEKLRQDSSICPPGCDPQVFEETVELREVKYDIEAHIKENERNIEIAKRSVIMKNKEIKLKTLILEESQGKLQELLDMKQGLLNEIECTIVLPTEQCAIESLQGIMEGDHACENSGALLFPAPYIDKLKARILELLKEEQEQRRRYFLNLNHVRRMKVDCSQMESKINELRTKYQEVLTNKLNIYKTKQGIKDPKLLQRADDILNSVLMKMTTNFKIAASSGFTTDMYDQLNDWKRKELALEKEYTVLLQQHTEILKLGGALQAELLVKYPGKVIQDMPGGRTVEEYKQDIVRLKRIRREQQHQINSLKEEIYNLKTKHPCLEAGTKPPTLPGDTAPPSEVFTPPCQPSKIRTIAASLVKCLADSGLNLLPDLTYSKCLLEEISALLPAITSGHVGLESAASRILESISLNLKREDYRMKMEQCKKSVTELLRQFMQENFILDEIRQVAKTAADLTSSVLPDTYDKDKTMNDVLKDAVIGLLEAGVNTENMSVIDAIVANLISKHPKLITEIIDKHALVAQVLEQGAVYDKNQVEGMIHALSECILAQGFESINVESESESESRTESETGTASSETLEPRRATSHLNIPFSKRGSSLDLISTVSLPKSAPGSSKKLQSSKVSFHVTGGRAKYGMKSMESSFSKMPRME